MMILKCCEPFVYFHINVKAIIGYVSSTLKPVVFYGFPVFGGLDVNHILGYSYIYI